MKKSLVILSVCLIVLGLVVTAAAFFSFEPLDTGSQVTHEITEEFQNIHIDVDTTDVTFLPSSDGVCKVVFTEETRLFHTVSVQNDTLTISRTDTRRWYEQMFSFADLSADIYLPQSRYVALYFEGDTGDLDVRSDFFLFSLAEVETDTGDICLQADTTGRLSISTDTGDITLSGHHKLLELESDTGDITLTGTLAEGAISIETNTGDVTFDRADGETIHVETDTGDVTGTLLTKKLFRAESDTGTVQVPWDTRGGDCIVFTDTGNIELSVAE